MKSGPERVIVKTATETLQEEAIFAREQHDQERFLSGVNFRVINDIIRELQIRVRVSNHKLLSEESGLSPKHITFLKADGLERGHTDRESGSIALVWEPATSYAETEMRMLHRLIHEAVHLFGEYLLQDEERYDERTDSYQPGNIRRIGLAEYGEYPDGSESRNLSLNEGVTETIASEIHKEYLARTGNSAALQQDDIRSTFAGGNYFFDRLLLEVVLESLSRSLVMPRDVVWKGFVHAAMEGDQSFEEMLSDLDRELAHDPSVIEIASMIHSDASLDSAVMEAEDPETASLAMGTTLLSSLQPDTRERLFVSVYSALHADVFGNILGLR